MNFIHLDIKNSLTDLYPLFKKNKLKDLYFFPQIT